MNTAKSPSDVRAPAFPTEGPGAGTIPGLLLAQAAKNPDGVAMREKKFGIWHQQTWRTVRGEVEAVALALADLGVGVDDRAGVIADNEPAWLFADLAIQSLGAWSIAAYPTQVASEVGYIMGHSGCRVVFCGDQEQTDKILAQRDAGHLPDLQRIVVFDMKGVAEYGDPMIESFGDFAARGHKLAAEDPGALERHVSERDPDDIAYIGFTSGTTGKPKGAMLKHRNQVTMAGVMTAWIDFTSRTRSSVISPSATQRSGSTTHMCRCTRALR
jgi:long-chain acyl-CoA synthetase